MNTLRLTGLDGQNPLGFFAALGLLRIVHAHAEEHGLVTPRLSFDDEPTPQAVLEIELDYPALCEVLLQDAEQQAHSTALGLAYDSEGALLDESSANDAVRDLKPGPDAAAQYLAKLTSASRRDADLGAGLLSDLAQDNNARAKPTAFHFTAGQQAFLAMVEQLRIGLTRAALDEALLGPWRNSSVLPSLSWDSSITRLYALRAGNPAKEKRGSVPGANWLGVHALAFFPVTGERGRAVTTAVTGGWKNAVFTWPLWRVPLVASVVASLLKLDLREMDASQRLAYGISHIFASRILRSDQGGYGSFTPADVITGRRRTNPLRP